MFQIFEKNFKIFQNSQWVFEWFPILLIIFKTFQVFLPLSTRPFSISSIPTRPPLPADENFLASDHKVISPVHGDSDRIVRWQGGNLGRGFSGFREKMVYYQKCSPSEDSWIEHWWCSKLKSSIAMSDSNFRPIIPRTTI